MAIVDGTNSGFVTTAPTDDPSGDSEASMVGLTIVIEKTSPSGSNTVTEIGWWMVSAAASRDWEGGIYDDDGNPNNLIGSGVSNTTGTSAGWKQTVGLNISISSSTTYWIGIQVDSSGTTKTSFTVDAAENRQFAIGSTLPDPWVDSSEATNIYPFYALWEAAGTDHTESLSETFTFVDTPTTSAEFGVTLTDSQSMADNLGKDSEFFRNLTDTQTLVDLLLTIKDVNLTLSEIMDIQDSLLTSQANNFLVSIGETFNISESLIDGITKDIIRTLSDMFNISDSFAISDIEGIVQSFILRLGDEVQILRLGNADQNLKQGDEVQILRLGRRS